MKSYKLRTNALYMESGVQANHKLLVAKIGHVAEPTKTTTTTTNNMNNNNNVENKRKKTKQTNNKTELIFHLLAIFIIYILSILLVKGDTVTIPENLCFEEN